MMAAVQRPSPPGNAPFSGTDRPALERDRRRFRALMESRGTMVWLAASDGSLLTDLPAWRAITGHSEEELLGEGWLRAIHPEDRERVNALWHASVQARRPYESEYRVVGPDGDAHWFKARGVPVVEDDGTVSEWVGTCFDMTEEHDLAERLAEERATLDGVVEQAPNAVAVVWGPELTFRFFNQAFLELVPEGRIARGVRVAEALPEASDATELLRSAMRGEEIRVHDLAVPFTGDPRAFEGMRYYDVLYTPIRRDGVPAGVSVIAQETTERVREQRSLETRLRRERELAESFQRALHPGQVPSVPGLDLAVEYLPAGPEVGVGGDWYDVVPIDPERVLLVVGDVCGRGLGAATTMSQLRAAVRAYAIEDPDPVSVLGRLTRYADRLALDLVTVGLALLDVPSRSLRYASAGHPPPLAGGPGEETRFLDVLGGPVIGLGSQSYEDCTTELAAGGAPR
jgi:PAS domain S-box-containing protein